MSLVYTLVFGLLATEIIILALLMAPLPAKTRVLRLVSSSAAGRSVSYAVRICLAIVLVLFADSVLGIYKHQKVSSSSLEMDALRNTKRLHAQRNLYLTGSVLVLAVLVHRITALILEIASMHEKADALKQQAAKTSRDYLKLMDQQNKPASPSGSETGKSAQDGKLEKELDIVKKQAKQTHEEYLRLTDEHAALQKKYDALVQQNAGNKPETASKKDI